MKILLVSDGMHQIVLGYAIKKIDVINTDALRMQDVQGFMQDVSPTFDGVLITDEAFSRQDQQELSKLLQMLDLSNRSDARVVLITRDLGLEAELEDLRKRYINFRVVFCEYVRIPESLFRQAFEELLENRKIADNKIEKTEPGDIEKKKSFLDRFKSRPKDQHEMQATDSLSKDLERVSRGISRIVAVTGHRGCGLTSTAVNIASEAAKRGLSAIILDMDVAYRSTNMYFSSFHELTKRDESMNASLIRTLARPQEYMTTSFNIKGNLWLAALGYGFTDKKLLDQFYNNNKLVGLLSVLRSKFNLVVLDMPLDLFSIFTDTLIHIDVFGLCVPNNLNGVVSTIRNVDGILNKENASYLNTKSKIVVTKYNDKSRFQNAVFTADRVSEVLTSGLSDNFGYEMKVAGHVPFSSDFDAQIETDVPIVNTSVEHEKAYGNILLRIMEGA